MMPDLSTASTQSNTAPSRTRTLNLARRLHLGQTLGPMQRGGGDPCMRIRGQELIRVTRTPAGPASMWVVQARDEVRAEAWGPGREWCLERLPDLLGESDDPKPLWTMLAGSDAVGAKLLRDLYRTMPGLRLPRSLALFEALVPTILEQRVAGAAARCSYRALARMVGERAPGPSSLFGSLWVPPSAEALATAPVWTFHRCGIEMKRAQTIRRVAHVAAALERLSALPGSEVRDKLPVIAGIGAWSAAEVALIVCGDPDAVSTGDYHLPHQISWAFAKRARSGDDTMLKHLEPYRGQRGRVIRLIQAAGIMPPRFGPRMAIPDFRYR